MGNLIRKLHSDQRGAVSIETIMILGAVALPLLIFLLKFGWPRVKSFFEGGLRDLESETERVTGGGNSNT